MFKQISIECTQVPIQKQLWQLWHSENPDRIRVGQGGDTKTIFKQESPPAWTQEAYRLPCSEYSFCCPTRVPPRGGTWPGYPPGGSGYPRGVPDWVPPWVPPWGYLTGYPPRGGTWPGYPPPGGVQVPPGGWYLTGYPPEGMSGYPRGGVRVPPPLPHGILGNVAKHYGIWVPPLWTDRLMDGQTRVKTLPSLVLRTRAVKNNSTKTSKKHDIYISISSPWKKINITCRNCRNSLIGDWRVMEPFDI